MGVVVQVLGSRSRRISGSMVSIESSRPAMATVRPCLKKMQKKSINLFVPLIMIIGIIINTIVHLILDVT